MFESDVEGLTLTLPLPDNPTEGESTTLLGRQQERRRAGDAALRCPSGRPSASRTSTGKSFMVTRGIAPPSCLRTTHGLELRAGHSDSDRDVGIASADGPLVQDDRGAAVGTASAAMQIRLKAVRQPLSAPTPRIGASRRKKRVRPASRRANPGLLVGQGQWICPGVMAVQSRRDLHIASRRGTSLR